ncbi:MAG: metallophosphoesterase [Methanotrichaceae archaeon]|nr:metallophosphoesterase [Methanotrichaceae archaeon]
MESSAERFGPCIVVSDVHLANKDSNLKEFVAFLKWLSDLDQNGGTRLQCNGEEIYIQKPRTIVLLGDIIEFWDPQYDDRNHIVKCVLHPICILNKLNCDIIYVIGNHDEDISDIKVVWPKEGFDFPCSEAYGQVGKIKIANRNFPELDELNGQGLLHRPWKPEVNGIKIGKRKYAFLHGHQFDRMQFFYRISRRLGFRYDPIDWFQDLANVSFARSITRLNKCSIIFYILFAFYIYVTTNLNATLLGNVWIRTLWILVSSFFIVTILPPIVTYLNTFIWQKLNPIINMKHKGVGEVIRDRYDKDRGELLKADTIVFGHTHFPGVYKSEEDGGKLFFNTGCWIDEGDKDRQNTFLYIDEKHEMPFLLKWDREKISSGSIEKIE